MDLESLHFIVKLLLILSLLYLAYIDWRTFRLPDHVTLPLICIGIVFNAVSELGFTNTSSALIGGILGYGFLWALNSGFRAIKGRNGIGMGDAKLLAALGAWLGWVALPNILFFASFLGLIGGLAWLKFNKQKLNQAFPFGPFLAIAGIIELLWPQFIQNLLPKLI